MEVEKEYDKGFFTDGRYVGCGLCAKVCPTRNIALPEGCKRYHHPYIQAADLTAERRYVAGTK